MLRKLVLSIALAAGFAVPLPGSAEAAIGDGVLGLRAAAAQLTPVERVQYVFGGQNYCWYNNGWQGPGFYWCGYAWNTGIGWGGGYGWNGWHGGYVPYGVHGYGWNGGGVYHGGGYGWNGGGVYHGGGYGFHGGGVYHGGGGYGFHGGGVYHGGAGYHGGGFHGGGGGHLRR